MLADATKARLLHRVISDSYEEERDIHHQRRLQQVGHCLRRDKLAAAIVDRVVHHGGLVEFGGPSHRLEESLMLG